MPLAALRSRFHWGGWQKCIVLQMVASALALWGRLFCFFLATDGKGRRGRTFDLGLAFWGQTPDASLFQGQPFQGRGLFRQAPGSVEAGDADGWLGFSVRAGGPGRGQGGEGGFAVAPALGPGRPSPGAHGRGQGQIDLGPGNDHIAGCQQSSAVVQVSALQFHSDVVDFHPGFLPDSFHIFPQHAGLDGQIPERAAFGKQGQPGIQSQGRFPRLVSIIFHPADPDFHPITKPVHPLLPVLPALRVRLEVGAGLQEKRDLAEAVEGEGGSL